MEAARGRWIAVLDADDAYDREHLHRLLELAETTGADLVADKLRFVGGEEGQGLLLDSAGGVLDVDAIRFVRSSMGARGQGRVSLGFLEPMVRASFLARDRIVYPCIRMFEDYFFALRCQVAGAASVVSRAPTHHYTLTGSSLTATFQPADLREVVRLDLELARQPAMAAHPGLARQVREHGLAAHDAAVWTGLVDAARARDVRVARHMAWASKRVGRVLVRRSPTAAARLVGRRLGGTIP